VSKIEGTFLWQGPARRENLFAIRLKGGLRRKFIVRNPGLINGKAFDWWCFWPDPRNPPKILPGCNWPKFMIPGVTKIRVTYWKNKNYDPPWLADEIVTIER